MLCNYIFVIISSIFVKIFSRINLKIKKKKRDFETFNNHERHF